LSSTASVSTAHGLVVGVDGSESSSLALEFAATEARVRSLPLEVVNTWECLTTYGGTYPDIDIAGDAKRVLDETVKSVNKGYQPPTADAGGRTSEPPPATNPRNGRRPARWSHSRDDLGPDPSGIEAPRDAGLRLPLGRPSFTAIVNRSLCLVHAHGELGVLTVDLLRGAVEHLHAVGCDEITVDLAAVVSIDTTAMRELARLQNTMRAACGVLIVVNLPVELATTVHTPVTASATASPSLASPLPSSHRLALTDGAADSESEGSSRGPIQLVGLIAVVATAMAARSHLHAPDQDRTA
jgi:anti-anti-sigma regulatory factor